MKIYVFYLIEDSDYKFQTMTEKPTEFVKASETRRGDPIYVYGFTYSKKEAKQFKSERNMKHFIFRTLDLNDEQLDEFEDTFSYAEIGLVPITYSKYDDEDLLVLLTSYEKDSLDSAFVVSDMLYEEIMYTNTFIPLQKLDSFNPKIRKICKLLNFELINAYIGDEPEAYFLEGSLVDSQDWNQLNIFELFFRELLSDKFYDVYYGVT